MPASRRSEVDAAVADVDFDANDYQVEFDTTKGKIRLDLWPDVAPGHCKNLIGLASIGFYDGIIVHRVIPGFVMQAGCPQGTGTGGPGYTIDAEFNERLHEAGVLSMARTNDPDSAGSQFFICLDRVPHLDRQYTGFGRTADEAEWYNFYQDFKRIFPEREPEELPLTHEVFHCVYDLTERPQVPSIGHAMSGLRTERADAPHADYRGVFDDEGRMMMIICHNTDLGDGWEREGENEFYFREFSEKWAYPMGINIVFYAMTH